MQCIEEFTNRSLVQVAQETLETRAHPECMGKIPNTCLHPRLSASRDAGFSSWWLWAITHTHSLLLFHFSISCSGEDSLLKHFRGSLVTLSLLQLGHVFIASVVGGGERDCDDYTRDYECFDRWDQHYWLQFWLQHPGLGIRSFQKNVPFFPFFSVLFKRRFRSFRSFTFFSKERSILSILSHSFQMNVLFFPFFYILFKRMFRFFRSFQFF